MFHLTGIACCFISIVLSSFAFSSDELCRHWVSGKDIDDAEEGDTIVLRAVQYRESLYDWGSGILSGMDFKKGGGFESYYNRLCSEESPAIVFEGAWSWMRDSVLHVTAASERGRYSFTVLKLDRDELVLVKK